MNLQARYRTALDVAQGRCGSPQGSDVPHIRRIEIKRLTTFINFYGVAFLRKLDGVCWRVAIFIQDFEVNRLINRAC